MDDPQLVGHAMMVAALVWFLRREARGKSAVPPILAMAAVGFYKHNIVAVPVTALLWLVMQDWRRAVVAGCRRYCRGGGSGSRSAWRSTATSFWPIC